MPRPRRPRRAPRQPRLRRHPSPAPTVAPRRKEVSSIDRRLERLQKDLDALDAQFVDAHDDFARILDLQAKRDAVTDEVAALEERWLELSDLID